MNTIETLASRLKMATEHGKIRWVSTSDDEIFAWSGPNATFLINAFVDSDGDPCVIIEVRDKDGAIVEDTTHWAASDQYHELKELHELARRSARGADKIIDELLNAVEKLDPPRGSWGGGYSDEPPF